MEKFMKKLLLLFLVLMVSCNCLFAESQNGDVPSKAIGVAFETGPEYFMHLGLSYQQWFNNGIGFQGTLGGLWTPKEGFISTLVDFQKKFVSHYFEKRDITTLLFGWISGGFIHSSVLKHDYIDGDSENPQSIEVLENMNIFSIGAGFGVDVIISDHISYPIKIGFTGVMADKMSVNLTFGTGIRYRF